MEDLFRQITAAVRAARPGRVGHDLAQALDRLTDPGVAWAERLAVLQERVLAEVPLLLVLDNFEDNLAGEVGEPDHQAGEEFLAVFLATWVTRPHRARLLITSRFTFTLPDGADRFLSFRAIGPLSEAESKKLAWSLPALDGLTEGELTRACRLVGGHPRRLEYLDALLAGGRARYPDITARLESALRHLPAGTRPVDESPLKSAVAETTALIAGDVLLDELIARLAELPGATELLLAVSVYRKPVDISALAFQVGEPDSAAAEVPAAGQPRPRSGGLLMKQACGVSNTSRITTCRSLSALRSTPPLPSCWNDRRRCSACPGTCRCVLPPARPSAFCS